jgi:hypothetical protein
MVIGQDANDLTAPQPAEGTTFTVTVVVGATECG